MPSKTGGKTGCTDGFLNDGLRADLWDYSGEEEGVCVCVCVCDLQQLLEGTGNLLSREFTILWPSAPMSNENVVLLCFVLSFWLLLNQSKICLSVHHKENKSPECCKQGETVTTSTRLDHMQTIRTRAAPLSDTPPSSPAVRSRDFQEQPDSVAEVGEDAVTSAGAAPLPPVMTEEERQELQQELAKVEEEIQTLSQVLAAKEKQLADIKRKLGITPLNELKQNITKTWQEVTTSTAYRRTSETLSQASLKATAAFSNVGSAISKKFEDVRNAPTFKSLEEKVETLKTKITPTNPPSNQDGNVPETSESLINQPEDAPTLDAPMQ
ncbi:tumor protein D52 isoform X1 [Poeciliopsis prolifica]|uniref:tumor protein D52 isoform X1 n=1 Tax=Poeciliopsis prolifica TaxID=188132 RepID=UPI002413126C|nr:tumor protein D52 isoform X1 [Poeciliopsis prolifica]